MDDRVTNLIRQGQSAAQDGNLEMARNYLQAAVDLDRTNATAWLWLAGVLEEPVEVRHALEQVLELEPENPHAAEGLAQLNLQYPPEPPVVEEEPPPPEPVVVRAAGTGMLGDTTAGTMTIEQQLRSQLPAPGASSAGGLAPAGASIYDTPSPTGNYVRAAGQSDMLYRVAVMVLAFSFVAGLFLFGAVLLRIV